MPDLYNPPGTGLGNTPLNELASQYASDFGHLTSHDIQRITRDVIFDAAPRQFLDLILLARKPFLPGMPSDEFNYQEIGYQRKPIKATSAAAAVTHPSTQTFDVDDVSTVSEDMYVTYQNNSKGTIVDVDVPNSQITVKPHTGDTLPAVSNGDLLANTAPIDEDGREGFAQHFRMETIERHNYIMRINKAIKFTKTEMWKLQNANVADYLPKNQQAMLRQFRIDFSNSLWNSQRGEVETAGGKKEKTTGGIYPTMVDAGSPNTSTTVATLADAFEDIVDATDFGDYGHRKFAFMRPKIHRELSKAYKEDKTRYAPDDRTALLNLSEVDTGPTSCVLVPYKRFEDDASFPASFQDRIFILDLNLFTIRQMWGERMGDTLSREDGVPKDYKEMWVESQLGLEFNNPLACGWVDVSL